MVDGLAEKRPSVIVSDRFLVKNFNSGSGSGSGAGGARNRWFEGYVHRVHEKTVDLRFDKSFSSFKGQKYYVRFELNRLTFRRMHQAVSIAHVQAQKPARILFPDQNHAGGLKEKGINEAQIGALRLVDRKIGGNYAQRLAVAAIVHRAPGGVPFIVFGP